MPARNVLHIGNISCTEAGFASAPVTIGFSGRAAIAYRDAVVAFLPVCLSHAGILLQRSNALSTLCGSLTPKILVKFR